MIVSEQQDAMTARLTPGWTVSNQDTYAVLLRPDQTAAARFHVISECEAFCRLVNAAAQGDDKP
jgi:hypothetical protein